MSGETESSAGKEIYREPSLREREREVERHTHKCECIVRDNDMKHTEKPTLANRRR